MTRKLVTSTIECNDVPVNAGPLLLANEEFNKEGSEEPEDDGKNQVHDTSPLKDKLGGDAVSKKRKASEKLHSSKYELNSYYIWVSFFFLLKLHG